VLVFHVSVEGGVREIRLVTETALVVPAIYIVLAATLLFLP